MSKIQHCLILAAGRGRRMMPLTESVPKPMAPHNGSTLIANHGIEATEEWAKNFVANFARKPEGNDRAQILAVAAGEADLAVANTYYLTWEASHVPSGIYFVKAESAEYIQTQKLMLIK